MSNLYIGLMSGTSADGIDAALVDLSSNVPQLLATHYAPYPVALRQQILELCQPGNNEIERLGELDIALANIFAEAVRVLMEQAEVEAKDIVAIGSHGQTIRHAPNNSLRFTLQIGDPNTLTTLTGITTVADFRRKDIALGGQGAPLVPAFHQHLFASSDIDRCIVNIGGIANVTFLPRTNNQSIIGFDTGPGNALMDDWIHTHQQHTRDESGAWAASGNINESLLSIMLNDPYFKLLPPKTTGREYFNHHWLEQQLIQLKSVIELADVQATLAELTALSITNAIKQNMQSGEILICGGGAHNHYLMSRLQAHTHPYFQVVTTEKYGVHPDWVEAIAFAWIASQTIQKQTGNLPSVTGAKQAAILGGVYYAS